MLFTGPSLNPTGESYFNRSLTLKPLFTIAYLREVHAFEKNYIFLFSGYQVDENHLN